MHLPSRHRLIASLQTVASGTALLGAFWALSWLTARLDGLPELWLGPWSGGGNVPPLVVVDAGHGGHDGGAVASGVVEKHLSLSLARHVREELIAHGLRVHMTRTDDTFISLEERSRIANESEAAAFVSLHLNTSVAAPEVSGIETYFCRRKSLLLRAMREDPSGERLARAVQRQACLTTNAANRGIKEKAYAVVAETRCPAVLVECGFLTHNGEAAQLKKASYQKKLAEGIARGIADFLKLPHSAPPTEPALHSAVAPMTLAIEQP